MKTTAPDHWSGARSLLAARKLRLDKAALFRELEGLSPAPRKHQINSRLLAQLCDGRLGRTEIQKDPLLRELFRAFIYAFSCSEAGGVIGHRTLREHSPVALYRQLRNLRPIIGLWAFETYPELSVLLLNRRLQQQYSGFQEMPVAHFVRYVPPFVLFRLETIAERTEETIWTRWMARGNNIRRAPHLPFPLSKGMAHWLAQAPPPLTFREAFFYCRVRHAGGSEYLFQELQNFYGRTGQDWCFLDEMVRFLVREGIEASPNRTDLYQVLTYIEHRRQEDSSFSFKGRKLAALSRQAQAWEVARVRAAQAARMAAYAPSWKGLPINGFEQTDGSSRRVIQQLTTQVDLHEEGLDMHHCVATYAHQCALGRSSIWSLRRIDKEENFERLVTLEVLKGGIIVQACGPYNARPREAEQGLIEIWARREGLKLRY